MSGLHLRRSTDAPGHEGRPACRDGGLLWLSDDDSPLDGPRIRVDARLGWVLRTARLTAPDATPLSRLRASLDAFCRTFPYGPDDRAPGGHAVSVAAMDALVTPLISGATTGSDASPRGRPGARPAAPSPDRRRRRGATRGAVRRRDDPRPAQLRDAARWWLDEGGRVPA